mgnify:CR=1 FL=1
MRQAAVSRSSSGHGVVVLILAFVRYRGVMERCQEEADGKPREKSDDEDTGPWVLEDEFPEDYVSTFASSSYVYL